jgi:hypothetical protein
MFSGRLTHATIRFLDWIALKILPPDKGPGHLRTASAARKTPIST